VLLSRRLGGAELDVVVVKIPVVEHDVPAATGRVALIDESLERQHLVPVFEILAHAAAFIC
jgi:hypothetical protein